MARTRSGKSTLFIPPWIFIVTVTLLVARLGMRFCEKVSPHVTEGAIAWQKPEVIEKIDPNSEQLLLLDFTAEWCGPCKKMEQTTFADRNVVASLPKNLVPIRVLDRKFEDGDNSKLVADLQDKYNNYSFPQLVLALADGSRVDYEAGYQSPNAFRNFLKSGEHAAWLLRAKQSMYKLDYQKAKQYLDKYDATPDWKAQQSGLADKVTIYWHVFSAGGEKEHARELIDRAEASVINYRKEMLEKMPDIKPTDDFPLPLFKFMKGEISEEELLKQAAATRYHESDAHLCIGLAALASGDKAKAKAQFMTVVTKGSSYYDSADVAKGFLGALK